MFKRFRKQVNIVIRDQVIRYMVSTHPTAEGITYYGEKVLPYGILEEGKIMDAAAFQEVISGLAAEKGWKRTPLFFCVPDSSVAIRDHLVPKELTKEEIRSYIQLELNETIRLPFANPVFDFVLAGEEKGQMKILLFACPEDRIHSYRRVFEKAGLRPVAADLASLSVYRMYNRLGKASDTEHLLSIQWNMDAMILTAFHKKTPLFSRYVKNPAGQTEWEWNDHTSRHIWDAEEEEIDNLVENQLVTIDRFMDFYQYSIMDGTEEINKVLLTGDVPFIGKTEHLLQSRYNLTIETLNSMEKDFGFPPEYFEVLGLSMKK